MKKFALSIASVVLFLTAISVPTSLMADGNPAPYCSDGSPCKPHLPFRACRSRFRSKNEGARRDIQLWATVLRGIVPPSSP